MPLTSARGVPDCLYRCEKKRSLENLFFKLPHSKLSHQAPTIHSIRGRAPPVQLDSCTDATNESSYLIIVIHVLRVLKGSTVDGVPNCWTGFSFTDSDTLLVCIPHILRCRFLFGACPRQLRKFNIHALPQHGL